MSLRIVVGPMFAGKTSEIQSVVRRYNCLKKSVLVLTADIDNRYQQTADMAVINHDRIAIKAHGIRITEGGLTEVLAWSDYAEATAIVIDEAQFFTGLIAFVQTAVDRDGKHVVVVGLDSDAEQRPFGEVLALAAHADTIEKKSALCRRCGDGTPAIFTRRLAVPIAEDTTRPDEPSRISVGGSEQYEPVCRKHFNCSI